MGDIHIEGNDNFVFQDVNGSEINISFTRFEDYQSILKQIQTNKKLLSRTPKEDQEEILDISQELDRLENQKKEFERNVIELAKTLTQITNDQGRLTEAKRLFLEGKLKEANAILKLEDLQKEQDFLLNEKKEVEQRSKDIDEALLTNANEFLVKAQAVQLDFANPNRFLEARDCYKKSLKSNPSLKVQIEYGSFVVDHDIKEAELQFNEVLSKASGEPIEIIYKGKALTNLGVLSNRINEAEKAIDYFQEAIEVFSELPASIDAWVEIFIPLSQLLESCIYLLKEELADRYFEKIEHYHQKIQEHYDKLSEGQKSEISQFYGDSLNNLAIIKTNHGKFDLAKELLDQALEIRLQLVEKGFEEYYKDLADVYGNYASWYTQIGNYQKSLECMEKAIEIFYKLDLGNPFKYRMIYTQALADLGIAKFQHLDDPDSVRNIQAAIELLLPLAQKHPEAHLPRLLKFQNNLILILFLKMPSSKLFKDTQENALETASQLEGININPIYYLPDYVFILLRTALATNDKQESYKTLLKALKKAEKLHSINEAEGLEKLAYVNFHLGRILKDPPLEKPMESKVHLEVFLHNCIGMDRLMPQKVEREFKPLIIDALQFLKAENITLENMPSLGDEGKTILKKYS